MKKVINFEEIGMPFKMKGFLTNMPPHHSGWRYGSGSTEEEFEDALADASMRLRTKQVDEIIVYGTKCNQSLTIEDL